MLLRAEASAGGDQSGEARHFTGVVLSDLGAPRRMRKERRFGFDGEKVFSPNGWLHRFVLLRGPLKLYLLSDARNCVCCHRDSRNDDPGADARITGMNLASKVTAETTKPLRNKKSPVN